MSGENEDSYILLHLTTKHLHCLQDIVVATVAQTQLKRDNYGLRTTG